MTTIEQLKELIEAKHIKRKELAKRAGMSESGLSLILTGKSNPSLETLERIASALDAMVRFVQK